MCRDPTKWWRPTDQRCYHWCTWSTASGLAHFSGQILLLIFIVELDDGISSAVLKFANDTKLLHPVVINSVRIKLTAEEYWHCLRLDKSLEMTKYKGCTLRYKRYWHFSVILYVRAANLQILQVILQVNSEKDLGVVLNVFPITSVYMNVTKHTVC